MPIFIRCLNEAKFSNFAGLRAMAHRRLSISKINFSYLVLLLLCLDLRDLVRHYSYSYMYELGSHMYRWYHLHRLVEIPIPIPVGRFVKMGSIKIF